MKRYREQIAGNSMGVASGRRHTQSQVRILSNFFDSLGQHIASQKPVALLDGCQSPGNGQDRQFLQGQADCSRQDHRFIKQTSTRSID